LQRLQPDAGTTADLGCRHGELTPISKNRLIAYV